MGDKPAAWSITARGHGTLQLVNWGPCGENRLTTQVRIRLEGNEVATVKRRESGVKQ